MKVIITLLLTTLLSANLIAADVKLPKRDNISQQLQSLEHLDSLSESERQRRDFLRDTLSFLDEAVSNRKQLADVEDNQSTAADRLATVRAQLAAFEPYEQRDNDLTSYTIKELVTDLTNSLDRLESLQESLGETSSELINYQTLPEQTQTTLRQSLQRLEQIRHRLGQHKRRAEILSDAEVYALRSEQQALETRVELFQKELWSSEPLSRLATARQQLLERQIHATEKHIANIQSTLNHKRSERTEKLIRDAQAEIPADLEQRPVLEKIAQRNRDISKQIQRLSAETNDLIRRSIEVRTQLDRLQQTDRNLADQIDLLSGSLILSRILYDTQKQLPKVELDRSLQERIKEVRLQQFQQSQQQMAAPDIAEQATIWLEEEGVPDSASTDTLHAAAESLLGIQDELLGQLDNEMGRFLNLAIGLQVSQEQLNSLADSVRATVREHSFWMPSNQQLDLDWWKQLPANLSHQVQQWQPPSEKTRSTALSNLPATIPLILFALVIWLRRGHCKRQLLAINGEIGNVREDSQRHTPRALLMSILLEAPVPLVLLAGSLAAWQTQGEALVVASLLWRLALLWFVLGVALRLLRANGIAEHHFQWRPEQVRQLKPALCLFGVSVLAPIVLASVEAHQPETLPDNILGMLALMLSMPFTAIALAALTRHYPGSPASTPLKRIITLVAATLPLVLVAATLAGFFYSAVKLSGRFIETFYLLILWSLISLTAVRGLAVAARRIRFKRILATRHARDEKGDASAEAAIESAPLDMEQVNQQSLRLVRLGLLVTFAVVFYLVWSDLIGTVGYLDSITLWQTSTGEGESLKWDSVSLGDLVTSLATLAITLMLARNLPGLLEILILSRLTLRPGSSYAITTLLSYVIITFGVMASLSALGFSWSKLQWLVAALGVGLGFGLQEIFANFVSGLIILFERPARIGDIITIGDLSGTVSRIRIRATTIIDFDRKEIIVPNKSFVTDRLINWSLTDSVTRITITVGFAYGSDLEKARKVLAQAAEENSRVLTDPEPQIVFLSFGASTLDHELRVHVKELTDRVPATDELNRRIDALCRENDLEIAFSQLDIHIRSQDGSKEASLPQENAPTKPNDADK